MSSSKVLSGSIALLISSAGQSLIQIIVLAVLARYILPESFGVLALTLAIGDLVRVLARFGISHAIIQREDVSKLTLTTAYWASLVLGMGCFGAIYLLSNSISSYFSMPELEFVLHLFSFTVLITAFSIIPESLLYRDYEFKIIGLARLVGYLIGYGIVGVGLAVNGLEYKALAYAYFVQYMVISLVFIFKARFFPGFEFDFVEIKRIISFGFGYSIGQLATISALRADSLVIAKLLGPVALSFYDRSYQLMRFPAFLLATIVDDVLFPIFSKNQSSTRLLKVGFLNGLGLLSVVLFPLTVILVIKAELVIGVLLGPNWSSAVPIFAILCSALFFRSAQRVGTALMRALGRVYQSAIFQIVYLIMVLVAVYIGSTCGLSAVAALVAVAIVLNFIFITFYASLVIDVKPLEVILYSVAGFIPSLIFFVFNFASMLLVDVYEFSLLYDSILTLFLNAISLLLVFRFFEVIVPAKLSNWINVYIVPKVLSKLSK